MIPKIAVAVSGGVDSLVAAYLLKKKYKNIIGLHFLTGYEQSRAYPLVKSNKTTLDASCITPFQDHPISHISKQLDIPIKIIDCRDSFNKKVVDYFIKSYLTGETPNPCMICNPAIKFGIILKQALKMGVSFFATGHYARIEKINSLYKLKKGIDSNKDQSYFLALLPQSKLPYIQFPLGKMTKPQVKEIARTNGLTPVSKNESQDVCFINNNGYAQFIASQKGFIKKSGQITDLRGNPIGTHDGLHKYTIGQRRGINCPAKEPYYVLKINPEQNRLVVGHKKDLFKEKCTIKNINWLIPRPKSQIKIWSKIRYRHQAVEATLIPKPDNSAIIHFKTPQAAITPGQAAVCYLEDDVIAAGMIYEKSN